MTNDMYREFKGWKVQAPGLANRNANVIARTTTSSLSTFSYLDKQWLHNLENLKLDDRPHTVPAIMRDESASTIYLPNIKKGLDKPTENNVRMYERSYLKYPNKPPRQPHITCKSSKLNHKDLTNGQRRYLWNTAKCYSVQHLKELTQHRMKCILDYEFMKRYVTKDVPSGVKTNLWKEYCSYRVQINGSVKTRGFCSSCSPNMMKARVPLPSAAESLSDDVQEGKPSVGNGDLDNGREKLSSIHVDFDNGINKDDDCDSDSSDDLSKFVVSEGKHEDHSEALKNESNADPVAAVKRVRPKSAKFQRRVASAVQVYSLDTEIGS